MIKGKFLKIPLFILTLVFCLYFSGLTIAGDCANENDYGGPQTISENYKYTDCWNIVEPGDLAWDIDNSPPSMMDAGQSVALAVIGDNTPDTYKWSVQGGNGFSLATPDGVENTLSTTPDACGTAKITVTGCDGKTINAFVRSTHESGWVYIRNGNACELSGPYDNIHWYGSGATAWKTLGHKQVHQYLIKYNEPDCWASLPHWCPDGEGMCLLVGTEWEEHYCTCAVENTYTEYVNENETRVLIY
ncbi:MAG: hypothetical protein ISR63_00965 [Desulfobacterales bacterium]|nr:hypothetical protein [Desulfobacterales bacterium]